MLELLRKEAPHVDLDFLRGRLRVLIQAVMEAEVDTKTGPIFGERSPVNTDPPAQITAE